MRYFLPILFLAGVLQAQTVTTTLYYNNDDAAIGWRSDDMEPIANRMNQFGAAVQTAISNHMVLSPAVITSYFGNDKANWDIMQSWIDSGACQPLSHSDTHPNFLSNDVWYAEFVGSSQKLKDGLQYPWQMRYYGREYLTAFMLWGGGTNVDRNLFVPYCASNGYLMVSDWSSAYYGWPVWSNSINSFGLTPISMYQDAVISNGITAGSSNVLQIASVVSNHQIFVLSGHAWMDGEDVIGTNASFWNTYFHDILGNRKNVWYFGMNDLVQYRFLQYVSPPTITSSNDASTVYVSVMGNHTNRLKYGLSYPITYKVTKPAGWPTNTYVYYSDPGTGTNWYSLVEKTTNDYFTGINCFRNDTTGQCVYVSQGLSPIGGVDSFSLKISTNFVSLPVEPVWVQPTTYLPAWFRSN